MKAIIPYLLTLAGAICITTISSAQKPALRLFKGTFEQGRAEAEQKGKFLFAYLTSDEPDVTPFGFDCSKTMATAWDERFVTIAGDLDVTGSNHFLTSNYPISGFPAAFVFDSKGGLLFRTGRIASEKALGKVMDSLERQQRGGEKSLAAYDQEYLEGRRDKNFLMDYLSQSMRYPVYANQKALDEYVGQLEVDDFSNYETVLFILKCGPALTSRAYKLAYMNRVIVDSIYSTQALSLRKKINGQIIRNTLDEAIRTRNYSELQQLRTFIVNSWSKNYVFGQLSSQFHQLKYNRAVGDTAAYLQSASNFYDRFYMRMTPDSAAKLAYAGHLGKSVKYNIPVLDSAGMHSYQKVKEQWDSLYRIRYAKALYRGADSFNELAVKEDKYLDLAIQWIRKAISLYPGQPAYYRTFASLLDRKGFGDEAEARRRKADELDRSYER